MHQARPKIEIKALRDWYGLPQAEFARAVSVSEHAVVRWEQGDAKPMPLAQRSLEALEDVRERLVRRYGEQGARDWLRRPNRALRRNTPLAVLVASGAMPVRELVHGAEAGTYR